MNREALQQRVTMITAEMKQMQANHAKLEGHLSECTHWLAELTKKEQEEAKANGEVDNQDTEQAA